MKSDHQPGFIRRFFSGLWKGITWVRTGLANVIFILLILVVIVALAPEEPRQMPKDIALHLAPSGLLVDQYSYVDPMTQFLEQRSQRETETRVRDIIEALDRAATDPAITSLVLELDELVGGGLSKLEEIGSALQRFKDSGKPIYAVSDAYSQEQYYLASYADEITMHPMGAVILTGYGSYRNYFRSALEKLSLNMHVFRVGEYKDAVEPYLRDGMSDASREHNGQWLNELWSTYTARVEQQRELAAGSIDHYVNQLDKHLRQYKGDHALAAREMGLVDQLATHHQQNRWLIEKVGEDADNQHFRALNYREYLTLSEATARHKKVGLIVARGVILDGEQAPGNIGGDTLSDLIRSAREEHDIEALVLRVDSGGGSAFASELIRQELEVTRKAGIPIFVSMGSVAASGGYWISMGADEVWATPTTITGSIGVFSAFPTLENSLQKLGIHTDGVGTTDLAGALRVDRPLSPQAEIILQQSVNNIYQRFLDLVAQARQSTSAQIHTVGQGRVWTGRAAQELGLIDQLGDLQQTLAAAAAKAGLTEFDVEEIEIPLSPGEQLAQQLADEFSSSGIAERFAQSGLVTGLGLLEQQLRPLATLMQMNDPNAVYAQCLECMAP
ncbi:signal peptide peptidase SppA [Pseudomaricurvus alkylphenolicus]|uniref:signal peptide peptidase SppA n=1 Tax=Pseudomaricurvus alkylphenolicus TaxID=1306991 RepID=UPI00141FA4A7|nr:signal peptide peptidase SppA [Pseudomaricurvus alkylphenolicus]NIB41982.1 signal peptide peptidase SppA [Pseudomaricurvus alkylphenolicus]